MQLIMLPQDKANHVVYGMACFIVGAYAGQWLGLPPGLSGMGLTAIVGAGKEAADAFLNWRVTNDPLQGPHDCSALDFIATMSGGMMGWASLEASP